MWSPGRHCRRVQLPISFVFSNIFSAESKINDAVIEHWFIDVTMQTHTVRQHVPLVWQSLIIVIQSSAFWKCPQLIMVLYTLHIWVRVIDIERVHYNITIYLHSQTVKYTRFGSNLIFKYDFSFFNCNELWSSVLVSLHLFSFQTSIIFTVVL